MTELRSVLAEIDRVLGDPAGWQAPVEFPDSLALCALNSAYSLRAGSTSAINVLNRYRKARPTADSDSGLDLLAAMDEHGGPDAFARDVLQNGSKLPGTDRVRTIGIYEALTRLASPDVGVETTADLREKADKPATKRAWLSVSGLGPASWSYLLMNAGVDSETKADEMLMRFVSRAVGRKVKPGETRELTLAAARERNVEPRRLDRAIWWHESPHGS